MAGYLCFECFCDDFTVQHFPHCRTLGPVSNLNAPQPQPEHNALPAVWDMVIADMHERDRVGTVNYKTRLQPFNGRDALVDAYQEAQDLCAYLRQVLYERDGE